MKKILIPAFTLLLSISALYAGGYEIGDKAADFKLKNIDGKYVSLSDFKDAQGFILVFTCNGCPYAQAYQDRIIALDKKYKTRGYPVIAINSNDIDLKPGDSLKEMKKRAGEKGYTFPYLKDTEDVYARFGATKTPQIFVLNKSGKDLIVSYVGAIDDNYQNAAEVKEPYLANAVEALLAGRSPDPSFTKAIGCAIKAKK